MQREREQIIVVTRIEVVKTTEMANDEPRRQRRAMEKIATRSDISN